MPTRLIFGPSMPLPPGAGDGGGGGSAARTRADAITVAAGFDEARGTLSQATHGWAEFDMVVSGDHLARVCVNTATVRYIREA